MSWVAAEKEDLAFHHDGFLELGQGLLNTTIHIRRDQVSLKVHLFGDTLLLEEEMHVPMKAEVEDSHTVLVATYIQIAVPLTVHQAHTELADIFLVVEVVHSYHCIHQEEVPLPSVRLLSNALQSDQEVHQTTLFIYLNDNTPSSIKCQPWSRSKRVLCIGLPCFLERLLPPSI